MPLSPDEKEKLDEWYIRNASLWLDLRIVVMTALMFFRGDRRTPHVEQTAWTSVLQINEPQPRRVGAHRRFVPIRMAAPSEEPAVPAAAILCLRPPASQGETASDQLAARSGLAGVKPNRRAASELP